jgi:hypothetical protein
VLSRDTPEWPQALRQQVRDAVWKAIFSLQHSGHHARSRPNGFELWANAYEARQATRQKSAAYRHSAILPEGLVHPDILRAVSRSFLKGDYDAAVFSAFKVVEMAVRKCGGYPDGELGVPLMRKAFAPNAGPLADKSLEAGEQEAQTISSRELLAQARILQATETLKWKVLRLRVSLCLRATCSPLLTAVRTRP